MTSVKAAAWDVPIQTSHGPNPDLFMGNFLLHGAEQL